MSCAINLMSPFARRREVLRARLGQWRNVLVLLLIILLVVTVTHSFFVRQKYLQQQLLETTVQPIDHLKEANKRITKRINDIRSKQKLLLAVSNRESTVTILGMVGDTIARLGNGVFLERIEIANPLNASIESTNPPQMLQLVGIADSNSAAKEVADELRTRFPSMQVEVASNTENHIRDLVIHKFFVLCTFPQ